MKPMAFRISVTDEVHASLREAIISGELEPGSLHSVYKLAERLNVSRTPVREAVLRLADVGMVSLERNRGVRIKGTTVRDIEDVFQLRVLLEVPASAFAAQFGGPELAVTLAEIMAAMRTAAADDDESLFMKHDRAFHRTILETLGNVRLISVIDALRDAAQARGASTVHRSRDLPSIVEEHAPILEAIRRGDGPAAAAHMEKYLAHTGRLLVQQIAALTKEPVSTDWLDGIRRHG
jgi:DNA-binding GntR family transcriptional regulator